MQKITFIYIIYSFLSGESWLEVRPPGEGLRLVHVSVGTNAVWAVSNDKRVWFRKGVRGDAAEISEDMAMGSGWVEMVGNMSYVSVAANDQVKLSFFKIVFGFKEHISS